MSSYSIYCLIFFLIVNFLAFSRFLFILVKVGSGVVTGQFTVADSSLREVVVMIIVGFIIVYLSFYLMLLFVAI